MYCYSAKLNVRIVRIPTTCSHCKTFTAYILVSIHISALSWLLLCSHRWLLYMCLAMLHSTVPGFLWFCTYLCFVRIFKSFSLLFYLVCMVLSINYDFSVWFFVRICFVVAVSCWLLLYCGSFFLNLIVGGQKNGLDNSSGAVRGWGVSETAGTQDSDWCVVLWWYDS